MPGVAANDCAPAGVAFESSALRRDGWPTGKAPRWKRAVGARVLSWFDSSAIRPMEELPCGVVTRFEIG